jgi:hypothetical protein
VPQLPLIKGDRTENLDYRSNLLVNFTAVVRSIKGDQGYILTHDGLTEFAQTNGKARGGTYNARFEEHYRVSGDVFEKVAADGTITNLGATPGDFTCSFASSFLTQAILTDGKLYYWDSVSLTQVIDPELGAPIDITQFNQIYVMTDGEFLFHTDISNEESISPLKYSSSEFSSDKILAVARNAQNQVLAFNRFSIEWFFFDPTVPTGTSVLQVIPNKTSTIGIVGTHCKTLLEELFFILGSRKEEAPSIHVIKGAQDQNVSTREIDKIIGEYTETQLKNVYMESRVVDRDKFVIVHLPNETLLYNHTVAQKIGVEAAWTYVKSGVETDEVWRAKFGVFDPKAAKWIYGDILENKLGYLDHTTAGQYGEQVEYTCYSPIVAGFETLSIDEFEIDTIAGYAKGTLTAALSTSYDGVTYTPEYWFEISKENNYSTRYILRNLGYVRDEFNYKIRLVSTDKMAFSGLNVEAS